MHPDFAAIVDSLHPQYERLVAGPANTVRSIRHSEPMRGVYLFTEAGEHLYVGRSNNIRGRYSRHCNPGATWREAAFAFRLARQATGRIEPTFRPGEGSRRALSVDPSFVAAFKAAKARIRAMEFRFVEERDPVRQCLLEVYCAVVLGTPYNDFDNH